MKMKIILFDDDEKFRNELSEIVRTYTFIEPILATDNYKEVLYYAKNSIEPSVYFIDIVINSKVIGLKLGEIIKSFNDKNIIVFISNFPDYIKYKTKSKVIAFNVIFKSKKHFASEIQETINIAEGLSSKKDIFRCYNRLIGFSAVPFDDIYYFERLKNSHKIYLYSKKGIITFSSSLNDVINKLDNRFLRCHQSFIVNKDKIRHINVKLKHIILVDSSVCLYSAKHKKEILQRWI